MHDKQLFISVFVCKGLASGSKEIKCFQHELIHEETIEYRTAYRYLHNFVQRILQHTGMYSLQDYSVCVCPWKNEHEQSDKVLYIVKRKYIRETFCF